MLRSFIEEFGVQLDDFVPIRFGSWVGGDRDGNPFVTPDVTLAAARRSAYAMLARTGATSRQLVERLSLSDLLAPAPKALLDRSSAIARSCPTSGERTAGETSTSPCGSSSPSSPRGSRRPGG